MKSKDIIFDEHLEMQFFSKELNKKIRITLSDSLYASEEDLTEEYKTKIANFISNINSWYNKAVNTVLKRAKEKYNIINVQDSDIQLMSIFILFEQGKEELYGLSFRVEFDIEHGCGLKIGGNNLDIVEIGAGDVAFC